MSGFHIAPHHGVRACDREPDQTMMNGLLDALRETVTVWLAASALLALASGWALHRARRADRIASGADGE